MQIVRLPRQLPAHNGLLNLNRCLHAGEIRLDWRDVQVDQVTPQQLDTLFHGLALDTHIEYIDTDDITISDALSQLIMDAFARIENDIDATIARPIRTNSRALPPPALWPPPSPSPSSLAEGDEIENEGERTVIRKQQSGLKKLLADSTRPRAEEPEQPTISVYRPSPCFVPIYEIPCNTLPADTPTIANLRLDMSELSYAETTQLPALLDPLTATYTAWAEKQISQLHPRIQSAQRELQATAQHYLATLKRIQDSIALVSSNAQAAQAFAFMNRAMWLQRIHTLWIQEKHSYRPRTMPDINRQPSSRSWQPLQLAFILLNIPALIDARYIEHNATKGALADLRWFPTDSWITEAYLGLIAYTLGQRRLQGLAAGEAGASEVSAILHYTPHQLTFQQFQHATTLICACETIRRADSSIWGTVPFRLGLRSDVTQHATNRAMQVIGQPSSNGAHGESSGHFAMLKHCPWCGSALEVSQQSSSETYGKSPGEAHSDAFDEAHKEGRTLLYCRDPQQECTFCRAKSPGQGLPVLIMSGKLQRIDGIERLKPALMITVAV